MSKPILYDLGIAVSSITLWLTPMDATRAIGYSLSIIFSARAYYTGLITLQADRKNDEKHGMNYEADVQFTEELLGTQVDAQLEVETLRIENQKLQRLIPLVSANQQLQTQLDRLAPTHPELTEQQKEQAARQALDNAFTTEKIDEAEIRKQFPEAMDIPSWKAVLKALANGACRDEVIKEVLGCASHNAKLGGLYLDYLKQKFMV